MSTRIANLTARAALLGFVLARSGGETAVYSLSDAEGYVPRWFTSEHEVHVELLRLEARQRVVALTS